MFNGRSHGPNGPGGRSGPPLPPDRKSLRGAIRADNWWGSKLPPLFALAFAQILLNDIDPGRAIVLLIAVLIVTGGSVGAYGHVINDAFDVEADRRIGKKNWMAPFSPAVRCLICLVFALTAFLPTLFIDYGRTAVALLVVECLLPALYSIPPVRLKNRRFWGVLADAAGAHVVPALIVMAAFTGPTGATNPQLVALVAVWTTCLGLKGILLHQGHDREDDIRAGASTFATAADPSTLRKILVRIVHPVEVLSFAAIVVVLYPVAWLLAVFFVLFVATDLVKTALGWSYLFDPDTQSLKRRHVPLASNFFYELWFPLALVLQLTMRHPAFAVVLVLFVGVFFANVREQVADLRTVVADITRRLTRRSGWRQWGWHLDLHGGATARLMAGDGGGLRVEVEYAGTLPWHIKLYRDHLAMKRGARYDVSFEIRADRARRITYCVASGTEPWGSLGLSEEIPATSEWYGVIDRFSATSDDTNAHASFLIGGATPSIELRNVGFPIPVDEPLIDCGGNS